MHYSLRIVKRATWGVDLSSAISEAKCDRDMLLHRSHTCLAYERSGTNLDEDYDDTTDECNQ